MERAKQEGVKILRPDSQWWYVWRELLVNGWVKANMPDMTTVQFQWAHRLIWVYYTVANCMSLLASSENKKQTALSGLRGRCSWLPIVPAVQANRHLLPCITLRWHSLYNLYKRLLCKAPFGHWWGSPVGWVVLQICQSKCLWFDVHHFKYVWLKTELKEIQMINISL